MHNTHSCYYNSDNYFRIIIFKIIYLNFKQTKKKKNTLIKLKGMANIVQVCIL